MSRYRFKAGDSARMSNACATYATWHEVGRCCSLSAGDPVEIIGIEPECDIGVIETRYRVNVPGTSHNFVVHQEFLIPDPKPDPAAISAYGYCPTCGAPGQLRERSPDGNTQCINLHTHKSREFDATNSTIRPAARFSIELNPINSNEIDGLGDFLLALDRGTVLQIYRVTEVNRTTGERKELGPTR